jgi:ABC-type antimicrobial peptide transport system permease subunit
VLGNAAAVVGSGIAIGMVGVYVLGRVVESMLFGVRPNDPSTLVIAGIAIAIVGALAAAIPARRAVRIDPMVVLRNDG